MSLFSVRRLLASTLLVGAAMLATSAARAQGRPEPARSPSRAPIPHDAGQCRSVTQEPARPTKTAEGDIVVTGYADPQPEPRRVEPGPGDRPGRDPAPPDQHRRRDPPRPAGRGSEHRLGRQQRQRRRVVRRSSRPRLVPQRRAARRPRIAPSGLVGRVDLNNIPLALVERVDTLTGGARPPTAPTRCRASSTSSPRDFSGVEPRRRNQITEHGDGNYVRADITIGANFDDGRGNAVFSVGYQQADPVYQGAARSRSTTIDSVHAARRRLGHDGPGALHASPARRQQRSIRDRRARAVRRIDAPFNFNPYNIFQTPFERFNIYGAAITKCRRRSRSTRAACSRRTRVQTIIAPSGMFGNVDHDPASPTRICRAARRDAVLRAQRPDRGAVRRGGARDRPDRSELPHVHHQPCRVATPRPDRASRTTPTTIFDYQAGVRGGITDGIQLDLSGAYGETENIQRRAARLRADLACVRRRSPPTPRPASTTTQRLRSGQPVRAGGLDHRRPGSASCSARPRTRDTAPRWLRPAACQRRLRLLAPVRHEPVGFALGAEYRKYSASQRRTRCRRGRRGLGRRRRRRTVIGGYEVKEAFGEFIVPLVEDRPFFQSLTLEAGVRYSRTSSTGRRHQLDHLEGRRQLGAGPRPSRSAATTSARCARRTSASCSRR